MRTLGKSVEADTRAADEDHGKIGLSGGLPAPLGPPEQAAVRVDLLLPELFSKWSHL